MGKIQAHEIKKGLADKHVRDFFMTEVKNGPTHMAGKGELLILDALAIKISWARPCFTGYEVKISRNDFLSDEKWPAYMNYCHRFYFACPKGLIKPEELTDDVGLLWYDPTYNKVGNFYTKKKAPFRKIEIPAEMLYYVIISRLENERHPFFSSRREQYQMWVEDKIKRAELGWHVRDKMLEEIEELENKAAKAGAIAEKHKNNSETLAKLIKIMSQVGINTQSIAFHWRDWEKEIKQALSMGMDRRGLMLVEKIETGARELARIMKQK